MFEASKKEEIARITFGSRLYGTATDQSDTDFKTVYLPDAKSILLGEVDIMDEVGTTNKDGKTLKQISTMKISTSCVL